MSAGLETAQPTRTSWRLKRAIRHAAQSIAGLDPLASPLGSAATDRGDSRPLKGPSERPSGWTRSESTEEGLGDMGTFDWGVSDDSSLPALVLRATDGLAGTRDRGLIRAFERMLFDVVASSARGLNRIVAVRDARRARARRRKMSREARRRLPRRRGLRP